MSVEAATYIGDLDSSKPDPTDTKKEGDDHIRLIKATVKASFPNVTAAVTPTAAVLNALPGRVAVVEAGGFIKRDGSVKMEASLDMQVHKVIHLTDPTGAQDAATKAYVDARLGLAWPVGSVYINAVSATNPSSLLGFGTWVNFGAGRVMVGVGATTDARGETQTWTLGEEAGEYNHVLTDDEMPSHNHDSGDYDQLLRVTGTGTTGSADSSVVEPQVTTSGTIQAAGGDDPHNNVQPSITVHFWRRTA